jgi:hypothetical protein
VSGDANRRQDDRGDLKAASDLSDEEVLELRDVWLSRLMFGWMLPFELAPAYVETHTFSEFLEAHGAG